MLGQNDSGLREDKGGSCQEKVDSGQRKDWWRGWSGGESCTEASDKLWRDCFSAQQMKEAAEQTQKRTKAAEETLRDQQINQGKKTKGTKFNRGRKEASAGPGAGYKYLQGNQLQKERKDYSLSPQM